MPGRARGFNLNLPLAAGSGAGPWFEALAAAGERISRHAADALVVSLGLDAYAGDPISTFTLDSDDFLRLGARIAKIGLPTVLVLEGGYAVEHLGVNAANVLAGFAVGAG